MRARLPAAFTVVAATWVLLVAAERTAAAYPQWQLTTGSVRCNECHYAPGGGGLITNYARDAIGDQLSTFDGDGNLLHGKVSPPRWLALGGDIRGAFASQGCAGSRRAHRRRVPDAGRRHGACRVADGVFAVRDARPARAGARPRLLVPMQNYQPLGASRLISREHYALWQPQAIGPYIRAGRFYAPYGLRFPEHLLYVRRDLGFDHLRESYNLSGGFVHQAWELHVTAFAPDFVRHIGSDEKGVAGVLRTAVARRHAGARRPDPDSRRPGRDPIHLGWRREVLPRDLRTMLLAEVDTVHMVFDAAGVGTRTQLISIAGFAVLPARGLIVTLLGERNQVDVAVRDSAWNAANALVNWFPYPHFEVQVLGRLQFPAGLPASKLAFAQLHYFF